MGKSFNGENTRARVSNKAKQAEKNAIENEKKVKAKEDASWEDDLTAKRMKKKAMEEAKKHLAEEKKKEAKILYDLEMSKISIKESESAAKVTRHHILLESEKKDEEKQEHEHKMMKKRGKITIPSVVEENLNGIVTEDVWTGNTDNALEVLSFGGSSTTLDVVPKLPMTYDQFETAKLPSYKSSMPTFRVSQMRHLIKKEWMKSPDNPMNKI
uniref:Coiled-coil domain-containing protein n=1 Tax=Rhabditophanes sp. KR3021 TaxID=114890 RepID=A0AC35TU95_9BILA